MKLRLPILAIAILSAFTGPVSVPFTPHGTASAQTVADDKTALTAFYNATGGASWANNTNWLSDEPLGDWHGVTTSDDGRVTKLITNNNNLTGSIPAEIGDLSELTTVSLDSNKFTGSIPTEIGELTGLNHNRLSGCRRPKLTRLGLQTNCQALSPLGDLSNLTALGTKQLSGSIPTQLGSLSKLEKLYPTNCQALSPPNSAIEELELNHNKLNPHRTRQSV